LGWPDGALDGGRHVVVLMGVNTSAGTLEFSDPLTGSYNGTTMAQFARTFTIYGSMAIVIERTARAATAHPIVRRVVAVVHHAAPVVVVRPMPRRFPGCRCVMGSRRTPSASRTAPGSRPRAPASSVE